MVQADKKSNLYQKVSPIVEISNQFIDDLKKLATLNKTVLNKEAELIGIDSYSSSKHSDRTSNNFSVMDSKSLSRERTEQIVKRQKSLMIPLDISKNQKNSKRKH